MVLLQALAYSSDGHTIAIAFTDGDVHFLDALTLELITDKTALQTAAIAVTQIAFAHTSEFAAVAFEDSAVGLFKVRGLWSVVRGLWSVVCGLWFVVRWEEGGKDQRQGGGRWMGRETCTEAHNHSLTFRPPPPLSDRFSSNSSHRRTLKRHGNLSVATDPTWAASRRCFLRRTKTVSTSAPSAPSARLA